MAQLKEDGVSGKSNKEEYAPQADIANVVITVDGPAGAGKSTVSKLLAEKLHILYLDTGAMYRAVALECKREGVDIEESEKLKKLCTRLDLALKSEGQESKVFIGNEDVSLAIRSREIDMLSSKISAKQEVREAMTRLQRKIASGGGIVAEGRDMGTVVFPRANFKFFITASAVVRAERRYRERLERGENISRAEIEQELRKRDHQDCTRAIAPLVPAKDAVIIDTTNLSPGQVVQQMLEIIKHGKHMDP